MSDLMFHISKLLDSNSLFCQKFNFSKTILNMQLMHIARALQPFVNSKAKHSIPCEEKVTLVLLNFEH